MSKVLRCVQVLVLCLALSPAFVSASPRVLDAVFDPVVGPNEFVVNFPPQLGGQTVHMPIRDGRLALEIDDEAGTARVLDWRQDVDPIDLFGFSTGPITVTVADPEESEGTFNVSDNSFSVTAVFVVSFDDSQLGQFGFVSPFEMTATESGFLTGIGPSQRISMFIEGGGSVAGSEFSYTCQTTARLDIDLGAGEAQRGDVNQDRALDMSDCVATLSFLFLDGQVQCPGAADSNGDLETDISDPVFLLNYFFLGGQPPEGDVLACE